MVNFKLAIKYLEMMVYANKALRGTQSIHSKRQLVPMLFTATSDELELVVAGMIPVDILTKNQCAVSRKTYSGTHRTQECSHAT